MKFYLAIREVNDFRPHVTFYFCFWVFGAGAFEFERDEFFGRRILFEVIDEDFLFAYRSLFEFRGDVGQYDGAI